MDIIRVSWNEIDHIVNELAKKIDYLPDWLIGVSRGGLVPVRLLSDRLGIQNVAIVRAEFYKSMGETHDYPRITQDVCVDLAGRKILIVDDVADTGRSLIALKEYFHKKGVKEVKIATFHVKPHSIVKPDFFVEETSSWLVYPWEVVEVEHELNKKK